MEDNNGKLIKKSCFDGWALYQIGDIYAFWNLEDGKWETTPSGKQLTTSYLELAERLLDDLDSFGSDYYGSESSLPWHYTMIDSFSSLPHEEVERELENSFLKKVDWSLSGPIQNNKSVAKLFGVSKGKEEKIRKWLSFCTHMQMTAACCIGNAYHSLNLAYVLADCMEKYEEDELRQKKSELANVVALFTQEVPFDVSATFDLFTLYYGIHLRLNGKIINI